MKLTLEKYGGLAAGIRQPAIIVDVSTLSEALQAEVGQLVEAMKHSPLAKESIPQRMRDAMTYMISVDDGHQLTVCKQGDLNMSAAFALLKLWIERHHT